MSAWVGYPCASVQSRGRGIDITEVSCTETERVGWASKLDLLRGGRECVYVIILIFANYKMAYWTRGYEACEKEEEE
jgi:hypothetical protein